jgi:hypothetical protein
MKKIIIILLCVMLLCVTPLVALAEDGSSDAVEENTTEVGNPAPDNENVTEGEISPPVEEEPITETIVNYVKSHIEELSVIVTLIVGILYEVRKHGKLNGSIGTLNNNAIAIVENSSKTIKAALDEMADMANVVNKYKDDIANLLTEIRTNAAEKKSLEDTLSSVETFLKTAKLATLELSNEVAELLVLANIPNSKKEELYARHTKAVHELEAVEEVKSDDNAKT